MGAEMPGGRHSKRIHTDVHSLQRKRKSQGKKTENGQHHQNPYQIRGKKTDRHLKTGGGHPQRTESLKQEEKERTEIEAVHLALVHHHLLIEHQGRVIQEINLK